MQNTCALTQGEQSIDDCSTVTGDFEEKFKDKLIKREFLDYIRKDS